MISLPVRAVTPSPADPATRYPFPFPSPSSAPRYPVALALQAPSPRIIPGMGATVTFIAVKKGLAVPSSAVQYAEDGSTTVLLCRAQTNACQHGAPVRAPVTTGLVGDTYTEITVGLAAGDTVVLPDPPPAPPAPAPSTSPSASSSPTITTSSSPSTAASPQPS